MPITAITPKDQKVLVMTTAIETGLHIVIHEANELFEPIKILVQYELLDGNEEKFHRELRIEANEKNQFFPQFSTNIEWNPDYIEKKDKD